MPFFQSSLSIKRSIDSPDSPRSYRSLLFHRAIFQPCPSLLILISISLNLSPQSLSLFSGQCSVFMRCLAQRARSMLPFIFHCSWALNSLHKHRHILQLLQPCRLLFSSLLKAFLNSFNCRRKTAFTYIHTVFMSLTHIQHINV